MLEFRAEGLCRNANHLNREELSRCMATGEVLQSTALAYDTERRLRFELGGVRGIMAFADCVDAAPGEAVKDIAVLTRVGRPTCFVIMGTEFDDNGEEYYILSRAEAQRRCRTQYLDNLEAGSVIPCTVTHIESFGAFCDIGCGIAALLPIDCLSVSRIASPLTGFRWASSCCAPSRTGIAGPYCADAAGAAWHLERERRLLCCRGRPWWALCAAWRITACSLRSHPIWPGWPRQIPPLRPGQAVSVYIKNILPDKMKIKLVVVNKSLGQPLRFEPHYFVTRGRLKRWIYSTPQSRKQIETVF